MTRLMLMLAGALFAGTVARAEVGGYRLISAEGAPQASPEGFIAAGSWMDVLSAPSEAVFESQNLANLLSKLVIEGERVARKSPTAYGSLMQRHEFVEAKKKELTQLVEHLPLTRVTLSFTVQDVKMRHINNLPEKSAPRELPFMVIGELKQSTTTVFTKEDREKMVQISAAAEKATRDMIDQRQRGLRGKSVSSSEVQAFEQQLRQRRELGRKEVQDFRERAEARKPIHMVYLFTDDRRVMDWRKEQTRTAVGVIHSAGLFIYDPPAASGAGEPPAADLTAMLGSVQGIEDSYVGLEFVIRSFGAQPASGAPLTVRKQDPPPSIKPATAPARESAVD